jgi:hypothetical protein
MFVPDSFSVKANLIFPKTANLEFPSSNVRMRG